ncbi:unnamed protein product [Rhizophagus irregularis]|nr:unnamed protein product [Rhizophagus irregularis]
MQDAGFNTKPDFKVLGGLPGSEEWKRTKIRSGWLSSSQEQKEPSFVQPFGFSVSGGASEFRRMKKNQDSFTSSEERKRTKIRSGGLPIFGKSGNQDSIGWISKFRSTENQDSIGWISEFQRSGGFPNSEEWNIKIQSGGFSNSEVRKRTKIRFGLTSEDWKKRNQDSFEWASKFRRTEKDQDS